MKRKRFLMLSIALNTCIRITARFAITMIALFCYSKVQATEDVQPLTWLKGAHFSALDRYLADLQRGYERGEVSEHKLYGGFRALYEEGADNAQYFDRWVEAYPSSYAARTARGAYYYRMAWFLRGEKFISETPHERIEGMQTYLAWARPDLLASLKMTAKPYMSILYMLNVVQLVGSNAERRYWLDQGNAIDPNNVLLRSRYMTCLIPRWGGSIEMMRSFRAESERQHVSAALLTKFDIVIHTEAALGFAKEGNVTEAFNQWDQVLKLSATAGEQPSEEALIGYARSAWRLHRRADADRALGQLASGKVENAGVLSRMGWMYVQERRMVEAWAVLQKAASLNDPWAQFSVGKTTYLGCADINLPANPSAGLVWIRRSADQGFAEAKAFLLEHGG